MSKKKRPSKSQKAKQQQREKAQAKRQQASAEQPSAVSVPQPLNLAKFGTFLDDIRKEKAAQLLAEKDLSMVDIAAAVGVSREAIRLWQQDPEFAARVAEHTKMLGELSRQFLIARKTYRLACLNERQRRMQRVIDARAADPEMQAARGGDSGLLARRERMIGSGLAAKLVVEFEFDAALDKAMRETEDQAAIECGQRVTKVAPTTPEGDKEFSGGLTDEERVSAIHAILARFGPSGSGSNPDQAGAAS